MDTDIDDANEVCVPNEAQPPYISITAPNCEIPTLEADTVYLLMKENIPISRVSRVEWLLNRINSAITFPIDGNNQTDDDEFTILSVVPTESLYDRSESGSSFKYRITADTKVKFLASSYRIVYCLDMSPSHSAVDTQHGEILFDEILKYFKTSLESVARPFIVPGSTYVIQPKIYLTVIAHTPFFMAPAQQVLLKGIQISSSNLEDIFSIVEKQLKILEERIAEVSGMAHDQIDEQRADNEKIVGGLFEEEPTEVDSVLNIPVVSPDANFVNMLRYSMLALSLLSENSLSNIIVITDGVVALPDANIMESLLMQLHYDGTAVSFIKIGSPFHPHVCVGYIPYADILRFLAHSTMGSFMETLPETSVQHSLTMNVFHKAYLLWTFQNLADESINVPSGSIQWTTTNKYFYGDKVPTLLKKKQVEDKVSSSLSLLLTRRIRGGFMVEKVSLENDLLHIELTLPWKNFIYLQYAITTQWPTTQSVVYYSVNIAAPYEFLHDITCLMKKELKSTFRQAVVERFWFVLSHLTGSDTSLAQHLYSFQNSSVWYTLPESIKNRMATFVLINNMPVDTTKPQFIASDATCPKFGSMWQPICQLDNSQWSKWFHTHKISLIVRHDDPVSRNLHLANSSGRFPIVQCRQSASILNLKLSEWSSFILIENHSYVKFLYNDSDKPTWFCVIRVTSKLPCAVINLGFINGTPGYFRQKVCKELKHTLSNMCLPSLKYKDNAACTILHKPLEKILIRYERMPSDFNTVVFPDGTQPPNPYQVQQPPPVVGALFTTLSRYLYHKRWIWNASYMSNPKLGNMVIAQILNTITKMRLKEGFSFAHSSSGIINMVLEVEMSTEGFSNEDECETSNTLPCVIQYIIFPPHSASRGESKEMASGSEDETEMEPEPESEIELQMITEVWIEPQYGQVAKSPGARSYMDAEPYYKLADKIGYMDSKCISSLLTLEHLSLMCQSKSTNREENKLGRNLLRRPHDYLDMNKTKILGAMKNDSSGLSPLRHNFGYFGKNVCSFKSADTLCKNESTPLLDERIYHIPFNFNLNNILPICQQTELLFSMFNEDEDGYCKSQTELDKPNKLLLDALHDHLLLLHDNELSLGPEDSQHFFELLSFKHNEQTTHECPISKYQFDLDQKQAANSAFQPSYPKWRCFIRGISVTHVILTFIPASLNDLKMLVSDSKEDGSHEKNILLPVYVYDCPLAVLINSYVNPEKNAQDNNLKDVYENHVFKSVTHLEDVLHLKRENSVHKSPEPRSEDSDLDDSSSIRQHCKIVTYVHSKSFVVCLFKSLRFKIPIHSVDVHSAVEQCEETVDEIDVTEYLKIICGHLKFSQNSEISTETLSQTSQCMELKPLHELIQEKFMKITKIAFQPVPTKSEFYFCLPGVTPDKTAVVDEDSDDEMSSAPSEIVFKSDQESVVSSEDNNATCFRDAVTNTVTDFVEVDEITPLFLHLTCSIHMNNTVYSIPVKVLPTCLGDVVRNMPYLQDNIDLSTVRITLDIICLTLPPDVQFVIRDSAFKGLLRTSFCCSSSEQASSTDSETSISSENPADAMYNLNHLPEFQQKTIKTFKEEVKWLLRDEIATSLLDMEPVSSETLHMVINHVDSSPSKCSCKKDIINLNFVYGASHSRQKFLQEFRKLEVCVRNSARYKLYEKDDLYYLAKGPVPEDSVSNHNSVFSLISSCESNDSKCNCFYESECVSSNSLVDYSQNENNHNDNHNEPVILLSDDSNHYEPLHKPLRHCSTTSSTLNSIFDMKDSKHSDFGNVTCEKEEDYEWLNQIEKKRLTLPNFWLILRLEHDTVTIYFHCRFLELQTSKVSTFLNVQKTVVLAIRDLCKKVNQSLLLQYLHDTRMCDRLLEPEDDKKDVWHSDNTTPTITRNTSFARLKSVEDCLGDGMEFQQVAYLEASLKFMPGYFRCDPVWETHFLLHPRLKTGPGKSGLSRGIQALRTVLNKFSVSNRSNMFVYQDSSSNVFYLRLHENVQNGSKLIPSRTKIESSSGMVSRSPSIASLPLGQQKSLSGQSDQTVASSSEIRPRVRSIGEKERSDAPVDDTIILKVHGITDAGPDVKCELVQVLQNRLDDAVLEVLSMMLARNAMCPLTPEDVQFLQKPFRSPEHVIKLFIPEHALSYLDSFIHYVRQNILQFLNVPKYTDPNSYNHFRDFSDSDQMNNLVRDDHIFLYNQSQNPSSGNRGIACVSFAVVCNKNAETSDQIEGSNVSFFQDTTFEDIVFTHIIASSTEKLPRKHLEFRIWKQGRVNLDTLNIKLKSAVSQGMWDLVNEYHLLRAPLCCEPDKNFRSVELPSLSNLSQSTATDTDVQLMYAYRVKSCVSQKLKKIISDTSTVTRKISGDIAPSNSLLPLENSVKIINSLMPYSETTNPNVVRINLENSLKPVDFKINISLTKQEKGEKGVLHEVYANLLVKWFEYAIELNVPAVKKCYVPIVNRHSVNVSVHELQYIISALAPDTSVKAFDLQGCQLNSSGVYVESYVPHNPAQMSTKCLVIGRSFEQWKISNVVDTSFDYQTWIETSLLKHYQKFTPHFVSTEGRFIPRQRLFFAVIVSNEMTLYTYNWSKERVDKLMIQSNNLGMWLGARASVLSSIVAQKRGLFHNQLTFRKSRMANNPYLNYISESCDHLYRFPSSAVSLNKEWINRKSSQTGINEQTTIADAFRDARPISGLVNKKVDVVVTYSQEMHSIKQRLKTQLDEKKKMHAIWQSRGATRNLLQTHMLKRHARTIHYCHTPLLFLPRWRLMSAATRDHSLNTEILDDKVYETNIVCTNRDESWHDELCSTFIVEYKQYLQTLGFVPLETEERREREKSMFGSNVNAVCYLQKPMLGGIMIFTIELNEPFFTVKLHAIECCRLQQKVSRNLFNQFTLSFLDECDRIKGLMHLHSFTYDFHLRCIHSYVGNNPGVKVCVDYHLTRFLDDFNKYYPKTPNFARNVVSSEIIIIKDLLTEGHQLYTYLLSNNKQYNMHVLNMKKRDVADETDNDYVLVQVTSTPQVTYKDSQDRQQTDDFNVTLIITNLGTPWAPHEHVLRLKFFIVLTSRREIYPKCDVEKTLGKFRTVSSTDTNALHTSEMQDGAYYFTEQKCENLCSALKAEELVYELDVDKSQEVDCSIFTSESNVSNDIENDDPAKINTPQVPEYSHISLQIKQESVNYLGYYSSHEQLMQQLMIDRASIARQQIRNMVAQGVVHCRTHLLWNKLVSHQDSNFLTYEEFLELRGLAKLENLIDFHPDLKILLDHPFSWYQGLVKLLMVKYNDHHRIYISPDGNIQHLVVLHPRYIGTFMMVTIDLHTSRGDLYAASRELPQLDSSEMSSFDRKELINGFINCVATHVWSGIVQS